MFTVFFCESPSIVLNINIIIIYHIIMVFEILLHLSLQISVPKWMLPLIHAAALMNGEHIMIISISANSSSLVVDCLPKTMLMQVYSNTIVHRAIIK